MVKRLIESVGDVLEGAAVAAGLATEVPDGQSHQQPTDEEVVVEETRSRFQPRILTSQPRVPGSAPVETTIVVSTTSDITALVEAMVSENLPVVLQMAPASFQAFLARKSELMEAQRGDVPDDKLESVATKGAMKVAKLTAADVKGAMDAARTQLNSLGAEFATSLAGERQNQIEAPTQDTLGESRN